MMKLAIINLFRRPARSMITAVGVAVAIGMLLLLVSFQKGYQNGLRSELDRLGAHVIVVPKGCPYDAASIALHGASWPCYLKSSYLREVAQTKGVAYAAPVLMNAFFDPATRGQTVYCGVDASIRGLRPNWSYAQGRFPENPGEILVGSDAAKSRGWKLGQRVALPGIDGALGTLSGILAPTQGSDDLFIYMPLADAQRLFNRPNELTHILVRLENPDQLESVTAALRGCDAGLEMTVVPLAHLFETIQSLIRSTRFLLACIALVALLAAGAGVVNTILMAVSERTREIGVLRAIGMSPGSLCGLIAGETVALCTVGAVLGVVGAILSGRIAEHWLREQLPFVPTDQLLSFEPPTLLGCLLLGPALGCAAAIVPAIRASRLSPVEAIREAS